MGTRSGIGSGRTLRRPACLGNPYRRDWTANNCAAGATSVTTGYRPIDGAGTFAWVLLGACDEHQLAVQAYAGEFGYPVETVTPEAVNETVARLRASDVMSPGDRVLWLDRTA